MGPQTEVRRDSFFQNYTPVPDDLFDPRCSLSSTEKLVYIIYLKHTDRNSGVAWPGNKRVAEMAHISIPSLKRISAVLETKGYISKEARFNDNGQQMSNLVIVHHPLQTADFQGGIKNDTPLNPSKKRGGIKNNTPSKSWGGITSKTPGGITHDTQTRTIKNNIEEEEETKIAEGEREIVYINDLDGEPESSDTNPFSNPEIVYEEPPGLQKTLGSNSEDLIESVKKKLGIEDTLAFLLVARCRDKLDKVIDQLTNAKKPIKNMTAYLLTLMSRPDQWDLFMENIENEFLTRERPKKKKREVKHKYLEEDREIYIPPSARNG
jgi:hypothetical protein